jgi:3',5'-cyclic-AMP phosphodiesterase
VDLASEERTAEPVPQAELTTVTTTSATFHRGTDVEVVDGLDPATGYERNGVALTTLPRPSGALRCRIATVNDTHFGETEAGRLGASDRGPIQRPAPGAPPYPEVMNRAAVAEIAVCDRTGPFAAVVAKGDLTAVGDPAEFAAFEACYRPAFGERLHAVRGNHDCVVGQTDYSGDTWLALGGLAVAVLDTAVPGHDHGMLDVDQLDWLDTLATESTEPVLVLGHHPQFLGAAGDNPAFMLSPASSTALDELFARREAIVAYAAGHTHRHRVQWAGGGVPSIEVGCVKDFPGTWAEYEVYDGGMLQIVHRISTADALAWSERCRTLYSDFGLDYTAYALGRIEDRCFPIHYR